MKSLNCHHASVSHHLFIGIVETLDLCNAILSFFGKMLAILALIITPVFGCNYKVIHYHDFNDPDSPFKDLPNIDIMNWDDSLMIFGNGFEVLPRSEKSARRRVTT